MDVDVIFCCFYGIDPIVRIYNSLQFNIITFDLLLFTCFINIYTYK